MSGFTRNAIKNISQKVKGYMDKGIALIRQKKEFENLPLYVVVGGGGFLGKYVCRALQGQALVLRTSSNPIRAKKSGCVYVDVTDPSTFKNLPAKAHGVIYLAQSAHYKDFPAKAQQIWSVNVQGVLLMLEYARRAGANNFVLASSGSVYAPSQDILREDSPLDMAPKSIFYSRSTIAAELLVNGYGGLMSTCILRFFTLYGVGLGPGMLLARMLSALVDNTPITLAGKDGFTFNPLHASDAAAAAVAAAIKLKGNHTINVAGPENLSLGEICRIMGQAIDKKPNFVSQGEEWRMIADISRMRELLGEPKIDTRASLAQYASNVVTPPVAAPVAAPAK